MANIIYIPQSNPGRWVRTDVPLLARYNQPGYDFDWYYNLVQPYRYNKPYFIKKEQGDRYGLQIATNSADVELEIRDKNGVILDTIPEQVFTQIPGDTVDGVAMYRWQWNFLLSSLALQNGKYFFALKANFGADVVYHVEEPFWIADKWPNTLLFEYAHDRNEKGMLWQLNPKLSLRVEGDVRLPEGASQDTEYAGQDEEARTLSSFDYRVFKLSIGGGGNVPKWIVTDKLNKIVRFSAFRIDGVRYAKDIGKGFDYSDSADFNLVSATIELRDYEYEQGSVYNSEATQLFQTGNYPYVIQHSLMSDGVNAATIADKVYIEDAGAETAYIAYLNSTVAPSEILDGTFADSGGWCIYVNAAGESYNAIVQKVLTNYLELPIDVGAGTGIFTVTLKNGNAVFVWGDGSANGGLITGIPAIPIPFSHTYAAGTFTCLLFHDDGISELVANNNAATGVEITNILGLAPSNLTSLTITKGDMPTLDLAFLENNWRYLSYLDLSNNKINGLTDVNGVFDMSIAQTPPWWTNLGTILFDQNKLTAAEVELFVTTFEDQALYGIGGYLDMSNQNPAYTPSGPTVASAALLTANLWTVNL